METSMKRVSELQPPKAFPDVERTIDIDDLEGKGDFIIHDYESRQGRYGEYLIILAEDGKGMFTLTTGASAVINLIKMAKKLAPLPTVGAVKEVVGKTGRRYYTLV